MSVAVKAQGITKAYPMGLQTLQILRGVSLEVQEGERVAIVGPSGAGKSTLLHALGGLDRPTAGAVFFKGRDLYSLASQERTAIRARHIGFVFQSYYLLPELDVLENVMLPVMSLRGRRGRATGVQSKAEALLASVGLAERLRHTPLELSGGEQQRVALARALINDPELLLADEPTGNLDTETGEHVLRALFALTGERRHTLILVTHNPDIAARCDRVIRLRDGHIEAV